MAVRRVEHLMGTVVSIDVRDDGVPASAVASAFDRLNAIEDRFSTFRPDSEISRVLRRELREDDASAELREVFALCEAARVATNGSFDIRGHRSDGAPDPTGLVKGWAVEEAASILDAHGARNYTINAGGDIVARGHAAPGEPWRVGLQHPRLHDRVAAVLKVSELAVATSGVYERGEHVIDPHTRRPSAGLLSATVVGPRLAFADAYATAALAMGLDGIGWIATLPDYAGCVMTDDDRLVWTDTLDSLLDVRATAPGTSRADVAPAPAGSDRS